MQWLLIRGPFKLEKQKNKTLLLMIKLKMDTSNCRSSPRSSVCDPRYLWDHHCTAGVTSFEEVIQMRTAPLHKCLCVCVCEKALIHYLKLVYKTSVSRLFYNVFLDPLNSQDCSIISLQWMNVFLSSSSYHIYRVLSSLLYLLLKSPTHNAAIVKEDLPSGHLTIKDHSNCSTAFAYISI